MVVKTKLEARRGRESGEGRKKESKVMVILLLST